MDRKAAIEREVIGNFALARGFKYCTERCLKKSSGGSKHGFLKNKEVNCIGECTSTSRQVFGLSLANQTISLTAFTKHEDKRSL